MEEKINLLYNFLYNDSFNNCFDIEKIIVGKINIDDIKISKEVEAMELLKEIVTSKLSNVERWILDGGVFQSNFSIKSKSTDP